MNIIPLVTAFILIITLFMSTQLQTASTLVKEAKLFTTKQALLTQLRRDMCYQKYDKTPKSRRESSLNLTPFIQNKGADKAFAPFIAALAKLYPDYEKEAIESMIKELCTTLNKKTESFDYTLKLKKPAHQLLFLELITGPNGSPPLLEVCHTSNDLYPDKVFALYTLRQEFLDAFCSKKTIEKAKEAKSTPTADDRKQQLAPYFEGYAAKIKYEKQQKHPTAVHGFQDKTTGIRLGRYEPY